MQVFYAPDISGDHYSLGADESKHIIRVLRMKKGEQVKLIDGNGSLFSGIISEPDQRECRIEIQSVTRNFEKRNYRLHIAISPVKNAERFEWFVEKAVEIGIDEITPLICKNTEKIRVNAGRLKKIIISAMKQSLKAKEPVLNSCSNFSEFISEIRGGTLLIAHCHDDMERKKISDICSPGENALILIGPEGDFTRDEIQEAVSNNFTQIHLGRSRLRTETAGIAACHSLYIINQLPG